MHKYILALGLPKLSFRIIIFFVKTPESIFLYIFVLNDFKKVIEYILGLYMVTVPN